MIGIGLIRTDIAYSTATRERAERIIRLDAARDQIDVTSIVLFNPDTVDLMLATLAYAGPDVVAYAPYRAHVHGAETAILQHAQLVLILDNKVWPRIPSGADEWLQGAR